MSELQRIVLPTGSPVWVRIEGTSNENDLDEDEDIVHDVTANPLKKLDGFVETIDAVVSSVLMACETFKPDELTVEFGVAIEAKTGKAVSVLVEGGGSTHLKVCAKWNK